MDIDSGALNHGRDAIYVEQRLLKPLVLPVGHRPPTYRYRVQVAVAAAMPVENAVRSEQVVVAGCQYFFQSVHGSVA